MWYIFGCFQRVGVDEFDYYRVEMIFQVMMSQNKNKLMKILLIIFYRILKEGSIFFNLKLLDF